MSDLEKSFQTLGYTSAPVLVVDRGALEKELVSIDENFVGKDLSKIEKEISAGGMIGVYNLINNNPSSVTCKVQGDSELIMLQTLAS